MWRLTGLFSVFFLLFLALAQQITKEFDIKVEFVGELYEEKPKLDPPDKLPMAQAKELNLSPLLLEAPKNMEFVPVKPIERSGGISCGEPKDALSYRLGVNYYLKGRYNLAEEELGKVIVVSNSPYKPMAEYVLGIIAYAKGQKERSLELFRNSCMISHMYQEPACEAYYALHFILKASVPENKSSLWQVVRDLKEGKEAMPSCEDVVFLEYCQYVSHFAQGKENLLYRDSTLLRSGIVKYFSGNLEEAKDIFRSYAGPGRPYRDIALYYLAMIEYKKGNGDEALRYAAILESINPALSKELYAFFSEKDLYLSRLLYTLTKDKSFLERAGIIAYNSKDYALALRNFLEAENIRYAVYSAVKMGDYKGVINLLKDKKKEREDYLWFLEAHYWSGQDMGNALSEVSKVYPDLYREYAGWERFRKGDWSNALGLLEDPYYRSLALYNLKKYKEVISLLAGREDEKARILKARSALMLGDSGLARSFLTESSPEEIYLLGISYFLEGDYSKSARFFEKVPPNSPLRAKALLRLGDSYYNLGDVKRAKDSYYEVLRSFPDSPFARQATLALLEFAGKDISDEELERLLVEFIAKEKSPPPEMLYQLALLQAKKGDKRKAEKNLIQLLDTPLQYKAIIKLAELEEDKSKRLVLLYKVYKEAPSEEERKRAREELINIYTSMGDKKSLADLLSEGNTQDKVRAIGIYLTIEDTNSALSLAKELIKSGYRDGEFEGYLFELYKGSAEVSLLEYLAKSSDNKTRGRALYLLGLDLLKKGDKRKALENFVEISLEYKGEPYYNFAVLEGVKILLDLGARRDASCMLSRFDIKSASKEELNEYNRLKRGLPKCEVR